jgi:hypothetical protein
VAIADQGRVLAGKAALDGPSQLLPMLYGLPAQDFHDVTAGTSFGQPNFRAGPGYDLVTGRGTPVANLVVADLVGTSATASAAFVGTDAATQGSWKGAYGADGYAIAAAAPEMAPPAYAAVSVAGASEYVWSGSTTDVRAPQKPGAATDRIESAWYAGSFTIDIDIRDGQAHRVALYAADYDPHGRVEQVQVVDAATGAVLDSRTLTSFAGGEYLVWNLGGHVQLRVTNVSGPNAVVSGLFFG